MLLSAAYDERFESVLARYTAHEGPEIGLHFCRDEVAALLGREDAVDEFGNLGVRHARLRSSFSRPYGTGSSNSRLPGVETPGYDRRPSDAFAFPEWIVGAPTVERRLYSGLPKNPQH